MSDRLLSFIERFKHDKELYDAVKAKIEAEAAEKAAAPLQRGGARGIAIGAPMGQAGLRTNQRVEESIANARFRPVFTIRNNQLSGEFLGPGSPVWRDRLIRQQKIINRVIPSVGRVEINNNAIYNWAGTGWLIDDEVIVTNRHVASVFCQNKEGFAFKAGFPGGSQSAKIDFLEEDRRTEALEFGVESVLWMAENLRDAPDVAFLRIRRMPGGPALPPPLPLAQEAAEGQAVMTIGYPASDPDIPDQALVRSIFGEVYDRKRLAPGEIKKVSPDEIEHDCSTLGGNSGSPVISLASGEVLGLHHSGLYMQANYAVGAQQLKELLRGLHERSLPRMRTIEISTAAAPPNAPAPVQHHASSAVTVEASIPIRITIEVGGIVSSAQLGSTQVVPAQLSAPVKAADGASPYAAALEVARAQLVGQPDILDVRLGYRFKRGWITSERAIVVEVRRKLELKDLRAAGRPPVPTEFLGVGVDVRTAPLDLQLARQVDLAALELPRRAAPGGYREPPDLNLEPVNDRMKAIFHVSPDSGFPNLKAFIRRTKKRLTATIYEWEAEHISDELTKAMKPADRKLKMVVQKTGTKEAVAVMEQRLKAKFDHVWASIGRDGERLFPSAYHIKVAVRDSEEVWLSSGNWKSSNQPDIDPAGENSKQVGPLRNHNREWHAIIEHKKLAECFEGYIGWDFDEAERVPLDEVPEPAWPEVFAPLIPEVEKRIAVRYFDPLVLDRQIDVTPLLTPDRDSRGRRMFLEAATRLISRANRSIDLQNQSFNLLDDNVEAFESFFSTLKRKQEQNGMQIRIIIRDGREFPNGDVKQEALLERLKDFGIDTDLIKVQRKCHTKAIIVDADDAHNATVLFGSHNLTNEGALYNRDASLMIRDHEVARYFRSIFEFDWEELATQVIEESVGDVRLAGPGDATPAGFRRVSLRELVIGQGD